MRRQLHRVDQGLGGRLSAFDAKVENGREGALAEVARSLLVGRVRLVAEERHPLHVLVRGQPVGQLRRIVQVPVHPQRQRLQPLKQHKRSKRILLMK